MENIDLDANGQLDRDELTKMAEKFAANRRGSKDSSRDPMVYGVAADKNGFLIRTGTRLYCIKGDEWYACHSSIRALPRENFGTNHGVYFFGFNLHK